MRLTLRTLLAYLDGILDPEDHEELAKQVETSDNAKELIHRTGDTVRRIRLGAPPVDSETHDANAVAEYLDNTMPPEEVVEFERRCLESDPELAEAASCHHILKMVLDERAEVDDDLRRVMYGLPTQHAEQNRAAPTVVRPAAPAGDGEVPDYLRASRASLAWRLAPAAAAIALVGVAWWAFAPGGLYDQSNEPTNVATNETDRATPADGATGEANSGEANNGESTESSTTEANTPAPDETAPDPAARADDERSSSTALPSTSSEPGSSSEASEPGPESAADTRLPSEGTGDASSGPTDDRRTASATDSPAGTAEPTTPGETADRSTPPSATVPSGDDPLSGDEESAEAGPAVAPVEPSPLAADSTNEPDKPAEVGMVSTAREVLLRYNEPGADWRRMASGSAASPPMIRVGDRLLSLPYGRPVLAIGGVNVSLSGATLIEVTGEEPANGAAIRLVYGRVVMQNTGSDAATIEVVVGDRPGVATIDRGAVLAVEAWRRFEPGLDPMVEAPPLVAGYYAPRGGVRWRGDGGELVVDSRSLWREVGGQTGPVEPLTEAIDWLDAEPLSNLQRQAVAELSQNLGADEPAWPQLMAMKNARRVEQRALAAIASMHTGHYGPSILALSDAEQRSVWAQEIEALRSTMSQSPELATAVLGALREYREERYVDGLYQLLCGYNAEQVGLSPEGRRTGVLRRLIDWLESDQVDYRVLANHNLEQITGRRGVFNPVGPTRSREAAVARFRNRLEDDELISRTGR